MHCPKQTNLVVGSSPTFFGDESDTPPHGASPLKELYLATHDFLLSWYFDSCASNHVFGEKSALSNFSPNTLRSGISMADGAKLAIIGHGTTHILIKIKLYLTFCICRVPRRIYFLLEKLSTMGNLFCLVVGVVLSLISFLLTAFASVVFEIPMTNSIALSPLPTFP